MTESPVTAVVMARSLLSRSPAWFYAHRAELEAAGFPKPIPVVGKYHPAAIRAWVDRTGGKLPDDKDQHPNAPWKRAVV